MNQYWDQIYQNKEWIFSGIGVTVLLGAIFAAKYLVNHFNAILAFWFRPRPISRSPLGTIISTPTQTATQLGALKLLTSILFIDDDTSFRVVSILRTEGWTNTQIVRDVSTLSDELVIRSHILFIDINGVGRELGFREEGLGLAQAIKERYPSKKVVIYSAETRAERFHPAWKLADEYLAKNSDPYEFLQIVEQCAREVHA